MYRLDKKIGVVVAEDEAVIRKSIVKKIEEADPDFEVVAEAANGLEALEAVRQKNPQVVITDIKMPECDGMELARRLSLSFPTVKVVVLSGYSDFLYTQQAIRYGVFNYLLKPVEDDNLAETLYDLKNMIVSYRYKQNRTVSYSENYVSHKNEAYRYAVFAVCIGNLCCDVEDELLAELCERRQAQVDWQPMLDSLYPAAHDWYLADEEEQNQKIICYSVRPNDAASHAELAEKLQRALMDALPGVPVSVCTSEYTFPKNEVRLGTQRMRNILKQRVLPARGLCFLLERDEQLLQTDNMGILKMRILDNLRAALERNDSGAVRAELQIIFKFIADRQMPQMDWQRVVLYALRVMELSGDGFADVQTDVMRALSRTNDEARLVPAVLDEMLRGLGREPVKNPEDTRTLVQQLKLYVDENYLTLENLEDLTQVFTYSYAHLSRLFSKEYGTSMNRYVLARRIELAKQLIENNESLSMTEISRLSGFKDIYYFSRAFKSGTGQTPTEYKNGSILKG